MEYLALVAAALIVIALTNAVSPKVGVAAPLLLVVVGIAASFVPALTGFELDPEWILAVLLPPLLYAAAVAMPSTDFRRELNTISGLSVILVVVSAIILGFFFTLLIPDLDIWWGIALGAVVSPTDAAATAIAKKAKLSGRLISILEGESLFNDATALVLLRTAVAAAAVSFSFWQTIGQFLFSITAASIIGVVAGWIILQARSRVTEPSVSTVLSFVAPFLASIPAEHLGASGLVAAVAAGLVTGHGSIRRLNAEQRMSDRSTWKTMEVVLEGGIFLLMGLQVTSLINQVVTDHEGIGIAICAALGAFVLTLVIRTAFLVPQLYALRRTLKRKQSIKKHLDAVNRNLQDVDPDKTLIDFLPDGVRNPRRINRVRRFFADTNYYMEQPLDKGSGVVLVWAGMRGAITLAAAQTLPMDTPHRSLLVLIAFIAATASLMIQGLSLKWVIDRYAPKRNQEALNRQASSLAQRLRSAAEAVTVESLAAEAKATQAKATPVQSAQPETAQPEASDSEVDPTAGPVVSEPGAPAPVVSPERLRVERVNVQYRELRCARDEGIYDSDVLRQALAKLDAEQLYRQVKQEN